MHDTVKLFGLALALGLVAMLFTYWAVSDISMRDPGGAAIAASFPFFGVAFLALMLVIKQRTNPDASVVNTRIPDLVRLLVLSGLWVFVVLLVWGL